MIIVSQDGGLLLNSKNVFSFFTNKDNSDGAYLAASYAIESKGVVIGSYETLSDAKKALQKLFHVLMSEKATGQTSYQIE